MLRMIVGLKGTGKTKHLIELANHSVETSPGHVVVIEKGRKLIFDIRHQVRLIDTDEYSVNGADELYGLVCGALAANFDIKDVYIDSSLVKGFFFIHSSSSRYMLKKRRFDSSNKRAALTAKKNKGARARNSFVLMLFCSL